MSNILKINATLSSIKSRVDRSYILQFNSQELDPLTVGELSQNLQTFGMLGFAVNDAEYAKLDELEAPEEVLEPDEKSKAKRMRNVLFLLWEYSFKDKYATFDSFYDFYYEQMINQVKRKLPERI